MIRALCLLVCLSLAAPMSLVSPRTASAQQAGTCDALRSIGSTGRTRDALRTIQLGLRTALDLNPDNPEDLRDGALGRVTRDALLNLCEANDFINADPVDDLEQTLALAAEYGALAERVPEWRSQLSGLENIVAVGQEMGDLRLLRLAGTPDLTAGVLSEDAQASCIILDVGGALPATQLAVDALNRRHDPATLCTALALVTSGDPSDLTLTPALTELSQIERAFPGAIDTLQTTSFATWLAQDLQARLVQLAGTRAGVIDLLDRYELERPQEPEPLVLPLPASCAATPQASTTAYYSFGERELQALVSAIDVGALLAPVAEQSFASAQFLWSGIEPLLVGVLDICAQDRIRQLVLGPENLGLGYQLDEEAVAGFKLDPQLVESEPVLTPLTGVRVTRREDLIAGVRVNLSTALTAALEAEIEAAAEILSAAAEPVSELFDTPRVEPEEEAEDDAERLPLLGITDASVTAALQTLSNPTFKQVIFESDYITGPNAETLKGAVRELLAPFVEDQVAALLLREMPLIEAAITSDWRLTPKLLTRIEALPQVARLAGDASAVDLGARMQTLLGVEYPGQSLFRAALDTVPAVIDGSTGEAGLSPSVAERAVEVARKQVANPDADRMTGPLAVEDCGCVPVRRIPENDNVYGFYPFWFSPTVEDPAQDSDTETDAAAGPALMAPEKIDYTLVNRVAFYGLEFDFEFPDQDIGGRNLQLRHVNHWTKMRRDFIASAHQHRAKVDLAFDLRSWATWTEAEQTYVTDRIVEYSEPVERFSETSLQEFWNAIPTLFDTLQPDGVTLIFEDYSGRPDEDVMTAKMVRIIETVQNEVSLRGQTVNVAFHFSLVDVSGRAALMNDLRELLVPGDDAEKTVDKILVFLERPTTETKKRLRSRMDRGDFRGDERSTVLRSLIPVIPPAAHEFVYQRRLPGDDPNPTSDRYSQFEDDLVYFEDNFAGIGFWPIPRPAGPETEAITARINANWNVQALPDQLATIQPIYDNMCTWACPRRAAISLVAMAVFAVVVVLTLRSFYSGLADKVAFRLGAVRMGVAVVIVMLAVLTTCDPAGTAPQVFLAALVLLLVLIITFNFIQRARNGPKP